jgi:hypothetical protein
LQKRDCLVPRKYQDFVPSFSPAVVSLTTLFCSFRCAIVRRILERKICHEFLVPKYR